MPRKKRQPTASARAWGKALENLQYKHKPHATDRELGEAAGYTGQTWGNWKKGLGFHQKEQEIACKVLGCLLNDLYQEARRLMGMRGRRTHAEVMETRAKIAEIAKQIDTQKKEIDELCRTIKQKIGAQ